MLNVFLKGLLGERGTKYSSVIVNLPAGRWSIVNFEWTMDNEQWTMDNGQWTMGVVVN